VEHVIGIVRAGQPGFAPRDLAPRLEQMGQALFAPPNVKGWAGGKNWLNSATVLARQNFSERMVGPPPGESPKPKPEVRDANTPPELPSPADPAGHLVGLLRKEKRTEPAAVVELLADLFLNGDLVAETRSRLVAFLAEGSPKDADWVRRVGEVAHALVAAPEFTLA
jgi:hypothetical protein